MLEKHILLDIMETFVLTNVHETEDTSYDFVGGILKDF